MASPLKRKDRFKRVILRTKKDSPIAESQAELKRTQFVVQVAHILARGGQRINNNNKNTLEPGINSFKGFK